MYIKNQKYSVEFSLFCERHFCKDFAKKYPGKKWAETRKTIAIALERTAEMIHYRKIDLIKFDQELGRGILKFDFAVAGTGVSPKAAGNRVIFGLDNNTGRIEILLVYAKNNCPKGNETQWFLGLIKEHFEGW